MEAISMAKKRVSYAGKSVRYATDGETPIGVEFTFKAIGQTVGINLADVLDPDIIDSIPVAVRFAIIHGWKRKVGDSYGSSADVASTEDAWREAISEIDRLVSGAWNERGRTTIPLGLLFRAIAELQRVPVEAIQLTWETLDAEAQEALRDIKTKEGAAIKAKADEIRAKERLATSSTTGLGGIFGGDGADDDGGEDDD
jgi:hypothetical protein